MITKIAHKVVDILEMNNMLSEDKEIYFSTSRAIMRGYHYQTSTLCISI